MPAKGKRRPLQGFFSSLLHVYPNLAEIYRDRIAGLITALGTDAAAECRDRVRRAVDSITLLPERDSFRINIRGELAGILALAGGRETKSPDELSLQIKMVAGARNPLYRTRFTTLSRR